MVKIHGSCFATLKIGRYVLRLEVCHLAYERVNLLAHSDSGKVLKRELVGEVTREDDPLFALLVGNYKAICGSIYALKMSCGKYAK